MPLPYVIESLEAVAEPFRTEYTEKDGKFVLNLEGAADHFVPKSDWKRVNDESAERRHQLAAWKKLGETPEKVTETIESHKALAAKAGDTDAILKQKNDEWAAKEAELAGRVALAEGSERSAVVGERLSGALAKAGVTETGLELLPDRLGSRIKFETVNGKRVLKVMMADGETPMAGSGAGGIATLDDLVKEATKKHPDLFKGTEKGGGGKQPDDKGGGGSGVSKKSEFKTEKERAAFVNKHGMAAYDALPA